MRTVSAKMRAALVEAGASEATAEAAAADVGELAGEVRVIKWMLGALVAMVAGLYAILFQIVIRLG